jgi:uncharacterized protein YjiS (DUF1127 family)
MDTQRREQRSRIVPTLSAFARNARATLSLWRDRVRYRRALAAMSERDLADTGVGWSQIAEDVGKPFWRA